MKTLARALCAPMLGSRHGSHRRQARNRTNPEYPDFEQLFSVGIETTPEILAEAVGGKVPRHDRPHDTGRNGRPRPGSNHTFRRKGTEVRGCFGQSGFIGEEAPDMGSRVISPGEGAV